MMKYCIYRALGNRNNSHSQQVILIPFSLQTEILKTLHDGPLGGHLGITRTEEIGKDFIGLASVKLWPNIFSCAKFAIKITLR